MIARRVKPGLLKIINNHDDNIVESYTMILLNERDTLDLLYSAEPNNIVKEDDNTFVITYEDKDQVSTLYKALANKRSKESSNFVDVSKKYELEFDAIPGTSVLVRDPEKREIKVAYRKSTNSKVCSINRLFISNEIRDAFFNDVREGRYFRDNGKFILSDEDEFLYGKWSNYMTNRYFKIIKALKDKEK